MTRGWIDQLMKANELDCSLATVSYNTNDTSSSTGVAGSIKVDIIGAGLAGTALALALRQQNFSCRIWEARPSDAPQVSSGVLLTPNGLRCLDQLGVLERIRSRCWIGTHRTYVNDEDQITKRTLIADEERYGYENHRIWRKLLLDEMKEMLKERCVPVTYNARFTGIDTDNQSGVSFRINNVQQHTSILIGADGIYSTVRRYMSSVEPEYTGVIGVLSHIESSSVQWPRPEFKQCTIQGTGTPIFMIPENAHGTEVMVGTQVQLPTFTRTDWERLGKDKDRMADIYRKGYDEWHGFARQVIDAVCARKEELFLWAYMRMPTLERWYSETGNVIIAGDAAHALPPSSGQGVNQALEDIYALTMALTKGKSRLETLKFWQEARQTRIDAVFDWAMNVQNVQRMAAVDRERLVVEGKMKNLKGSEIEDMSWLYVWDIDGQVDKWAEGLS